MKYLTWQLCLAGLLTGIVCTSRPACGRGAEGAGGESTTKIVHADANAAAELVAANKVAVLDVRTAKEYAAGHIKGAKQIDYSAGDFQQQLATLDKSKTWLVHCASGGRSTAALKQLQKLGFQSVVHLDGGFNAWKKAGKPVEP